ncbi:hypothetical protein [Phaeobacter inhibens]|uniref:hypothetical protein n=1 Tax=Phaeobacter inhibens TaxID=221822 RepID=UPI000F4CF203|nr:hypothetical protein [Phaeobacter inhibens]
MIRKIGNPFLAISLVVAGLLLAIALAVSVYWQTRTKWYGLGLSAGAIIAKQEVVDELCKYAFKASPPRRPDTEIGVKTAALSLISENGQVFIYCQGL